MANASSACASLRPPRPTYGMIRHGERDRGVVGHHRAGLERRRPRRRRRRGPGRRGSAPAPARASRPGRARRAARRAASSRASLRRHEVATGARGGRRDAAVSSARAGAARARRPRSACERSRPNERRVGRLAGGGVLAGRLAERADVPSTSSTSSTIWKARPISRAEARRRRAIVAASAPAIDRAGHRGRPDQRAGLARVHVGERGGVEGRARRRRRAGRPASRSIAWPPTMPAAPAAAAIDADRLQLARDDGRVARRPARAPARRTPR